MFRLLGSVLVLGAALWIGAYFAAKERYRLQELEELERSILLLQGQIQYLLAPLPEVLESISWKAEGAIGEVFRDAAERMEQRDGSSAEDIWREVWQEKAKQTYFTHDDIEAVLFFGRSLGYLDREQQEGSIRLFLRYLEDCMEQGRKRLEKNGRLYYGVSVLSGLLLVVTLL